jgi:hypothetical protein
MLALRMRDMMPKSARGAKGSGGLASGAGYFR